MEGIRIAPAPPLVLNEFSARSLREQPTRDVMNARTYSHWNADEPQYVGGRPKNQNGAPFYDMAPLNSRNQDRTQFMQAQPFVVDAPPFQDNPYFAKYDITSDPRNITRELRSAVTENDAERGVDESRRMFARGFDSRYVPTTKQDEDLQKALNNDTFLRPTMNNMQQDYRRIAPKR